MVVQEEEEANLYDDLVLSSQSASDQFSFQSILVRRFFVPSNSLSHRLKTTRQS